MRRRFFCGASIAAVAISSAFSVQAATATAAAAAECGLPLTVLIALVSAWMSRWLWLDGALWPVAG